MRAAGWVAGLVAHPDRQRTPFLCWVELEASLLLRRSLRLRRETKKPKGPQEECACDR